jgi:hypothetical protein
MGRSYRKKSEFSRAKDFEATTKHKSRQLGREYTKSAYHSVEDTKSEVEEVDYYREDLEFQKFTRLNGKR